MINFLIFTKDRPMQLDLLLRSIERFVKVPHYLSIVLHASDKRILDDYISLDQRYILDNSDFKKSVLQAVKRPTKYICTMVDDDVFTRSLILDSRIDDPGVNCFNLHIPALGDGVWNWTVEGGDYGYPMTLSSTIWRSDYLIPLLKKYDYHHPNTLEDALHYNNDRGRRYLLAAERNPAVNVPDNRVQSTHPNVTNGGDASYLLDMFRRNRRINLEKVVAYVNSHPEEYPYSKVNYEFYD